MGRKKTEKEKELPLIEENLKQDSTPDRSYRLDDEDMYDSNGNPIIVDYQDETEEEKRDKIFGNAYNTGETDFKDLPDIKADSNYAGKHLGHVYDSETYNVQLKLSKMCADAFEQSQWVGLPLSKKFSKELMPYIFNDLFVILDKDGYSVMDIFIAIAEFMDVSYEKVYWSAGIKVKERLIAECNRKFGSLNKKDINRLF